jgi:TRAP-type C4-dicarboxylate transport system substrate-binding protein
VASKSFDARLTYSKRKEVSANNTALQSYVNDIQQFKIKRGRTKMNRNMTRRKFNLVMMGLAASASFPLSAQADTLKLKYANAGGPGTGSNIFAAKYYKVIEEKTNGAIKVDIYAGTLGGEKTLIDGMALGTIDIYKGAYTGVKEFDILYSPYFFHDGDHAARVLKGPLGAAASKILEERYKARLLGVGRLGPYVLCLKKKISSIDEVRGLKIRTPQILGCIEAVKHLGANPTPVPFNEVYTALLQGVVDGFVSALNPSVQMKFYEVCKYVLSNEFGQALDKELIALRVWKKLTPKQQEIFISTFDAMEEKDFYQAGLAAVSKDLDRWQEFNGPGSVLTVDKDELMNRMMPLNKRLADEVYGPGTWDKVQAT